MSDSQIYLCYTHKKACYLNVHNTEQQINFTYEIWQMHIFQIMEQARVCQTQNIFQFVIQSSYIDTHIHTDGPRDGWHKILQRCMC